MTAQVPGVAARSIVSLRLNLHTQQKDFYDIAAVAKAWSINAARRDWMRSGFVSMIHGFTIEGKLFEGTSSTRCWCLVCVARIIDVFQWNCPTFTWYDVSNNEKIQYFITLAFSADTVMRISWGDFQPRNRSPIGVAPAAKIYETTLQSQCRGVLDLARNWTYADCAVRARFF
jgi:hypothetical protein